MNYPTKSAGLAFAQAIKCQANMLGSATTAEREADIPSELSKLESDVEHIAKLAEDLFNRLTPIMRPLGPDPKEGTAIPTPCLCPVADRIRNQRHTIQSVADRLITLNQNLEL